MESDFNSFAAELKRMPRFVQNGREKPHKLILLLTIIQLIREGKLTENRIYFNQVLRDAFETKFQFYSNASDWSQVSQPYFHLKTASFWHHQPKDGRQEQYDRITTSGGGSKRIEENIEFAYLSEPVWPLFGDTEYQALIEKQLVDMMPENHAYSVAEPAATKKLGTAFHEQFKLTRASMGLILGFLIQSDGGSNQPDVDAIMAYTSLGKNQVKSFRSYLKGAGMIDADDRATVFGRVCHENDPSLARLETQWMIHYNFSVRHGRGPLYWNHLVEKNLGLAVELSRTEVIALIQDFLTNQGQAVLAKGTYEEAASAFLNSYADAEGLGALGFLEAKGGGQYQVASPQPLPAAAFACILADYWPILAPQGEATVELAAITRGELAQVLHQSEAQLNALLAELATPSAGLIQRQRLYTPYTVTRQRLDAATAWDQLYA